MLFDPSDRKRETVIRWMQRLPVCWRCIFCVVTLAGTAVLGRASENPVFETDHLDLQIVQTTDPQHPLAFQLYSYDQARAFALSNSVIRVAESARLQLPSGTPFGPEGAHLWILPQTQEPQLVYLGLSAEKISASTFQNPVSISLLSVEGPGDFFLWQANQFGALEIKMNSRDGIDSTDRATPLIGSHEHLNWGFSTNGSYRVTLQASARRAGESVDSLSQPETLTFHVLPLPETPFLRWQREHFPTAAPESTRGPNADPDSDGLPNVLEYAFGTNPNAASVPTLPNLTIVREGAEEFSLLRIKRTPSATDLRFHIEATDSLANANWTQLQVASVLEPGGTPEFIEIRDPRPIAPRRFYRVNVQLLTN
jgi:surface-anchored protein